MPTSKSGRFYANAQMARAHDSAREMPRPKAMEKRGPENHGGPHDADHGGVAKVETIVHHQDGHREHAEHGSVDEAQQHLQSLDPGASMQQAEGGGGQEEVCPECHGEDPHCPVCDGTGKVPVDEAGEQSSEESAY